MATSIYRGLPSLLREVRTKPLFVMRLDVRPAPGGSPRMDQIAGGVFEGDRLSGRVLEGSDERQQDDPSDRSILDGRLTLETADGALIGMAYRGIRHGPGGHAACLEPVESVDPANVYIRVALLFETEARLYAWLNKIVAIGVGHRGANGSVYSVFEVL
jgi:hypothetical protein